MNDHLYTAALPVIGKTGTQVFLGGDAKEGLTWGDDQKNRPISPNAVIMDKKYYEILGEPEEVVIIITTEEGWKKHLAQFDKST
jgi:hypothetical protein